MAANKSLILTQIRSSHDRKLPIGPGKFNSKIVFDVFHFYISLIAIPCLAIIFYANTFYGPATLADIPEDYEPRHWEYQRHPIQRFLAKNFYYSDEQLYENTLHNLYQNDCKQKMRVLEVKVKRFMANRNDYKAWYYKPTQPERYDIFDQVKETSEMSGYSGKYGSKMEK